ncbi:hypothetical protein I6F11_28015, partial [Ensifer sp. NBAIM29]|nr:hypothetical protein [Ensifer sp. NBAIM29]
VAHPALRATPIGAAELLWVASPSVAKRMEEGGPDAIFSLWSLTSHSPIYQLMKDALEGLPVRKHSINLCNNVRTMIDIVTMGGGFALIPRSMVRSQLESGSLVQVMVNRHIEPIMFHVVARAAEGDPVVKEILRCASGISLDDRPQPLASAS